MKQKDHKEIARIIKDVRDNYVKESQVILIISKLADYFERESKEEEKRIIGEYVKLLPSYNLTELDKGIILYKKDFKPFNKKQFKEWCGVSE